VANRLLFQWGVSSLFGWGIYGLNLALHGWRNGVEVASACPIAPQQLALDPARQWALSPFFFLSNQLTKHLLQPGPALVKGSVALHSLGNNLGYAAMGANNACVMGDRTYGVAFFEDSRIDAAAMIKGRDYHRIIVGSHWNGEVLRRYGLENVEVVLQGVDDTLFHPAPRANLFHENFTIFSGGKLEFRKGQDLVLRIFRAFRQRHPEALLVTAWHSPWAANLAQSMGRLEGIAPVPVAQGGKIDVSGWAQANGIPQGAVLDLGAVPNAMMPQLLREMDCALFPNRCEGGTNLVAMEAMACGLPVVLSANSGQRDLIDGENCYPLTRQAAVLSAPGGWGADGWGECDVEEGVEALEAIYQNRQEAKRRGALAAQTLSRLTWSSQIKELLTVLQLVS